MSSNPCDASARVRFTCLRTQMVGLMFRLYWQLNNQRTENVSQHCNTVAAASNYKRKKKKQQQNQHNINRTNRLQAQ